MSTDKEKLAEAIAYAVRSNALEGLKTSPETMAMLEKVKNGELTFDEYRKLIDQKAKALAKNSVISR